MGCGETFLLLFGALAVTAFARWRGWSAPLLVTAVALVVSYIPGIPTFEIDGELILTLVLPPLLYSAALDVSFLNFRNSLPQIRNLGIWLVVATTVVVGGIAYLIMPSLTLAGALLLGAIVSPPDAVSAASIGRRLGLPRRVMTVMSGESLINDASSLTLFRVFLAIVAGSTVTWGDGITDFLLAVGVGVGLGLVIGRVVTAIRRRLDDPVVLGTLGLLVPFAAYAIAERFEGSGVLAVVTTGLVVGFNAPRTSYATRQQERPVWLSIDLLLEGFVFALIGLQLHDVVSDVWSSPLGPWRSLGLAAAVFTAVVFVRPIWIFGNHAILRLLAPLSARRRARRDRRLDEFERRQDAEFDARGVPADHPRRRRRPRPPSDQSLLSIPELTVLSWAGMRGVVTLATATAIPVGAGLGLPEAERQTIFLVAFAVTVGTLLMQGLTMPALIRRLGLNSEAEEKQDAAEIAAVRSRAASVGLAYLKERRDEWRQKFGAEATDAVFDRFTATLERIDAGAAAAEELADDESADRRRDQLIELSRGWLAVRRSVVLDERDAGNLNEEVMRRLVVSLDAEELALDTLAAQRDDR